MLIYDILFTGNQNIIDINLRNKEIKSELESLVMFK